MVASLSAANSSDLPPDAGWRTPVVSEIGTGIWRVRFGEPERFTPNSAREKQPDLAGVARLPAPAALPFKLEDIGCRVSSSPWWKTTVRPSITSVACRTG